MKRFILLLLMAVVSFIVNAQVVVSNVATNNSGTYVNTTDDFITFYMHLNLTNTDWASPFTFNVTATQNGSPVTVSLSNGSAATDLRYTTQDQQFRLPAGTAGKGNITLTVTPNWNSALSGTAHITDPGIFVLSSCATGPQTISYTYTSPYNLTAANNWQAYIPKFDASNGRTLTGVSIKTLSYGNTILIAEATGSSGSTITDQVNFKPLYKYNGTTIGTPPTYLMWETNGFANYDETIVGTGSAIVVPAQGSWPGDVNGSTLSAMPWSRDLRFAMIDPRNDPKWVTNATADATTDDDMFFSPFWTEKTISSTYNYSTLADLANFTGTGNIPITYSATMPSTLSAGGNTLQELQSQTQFTITVTYTYTNASCYSVSGTVYNDVNGLTGGIKDQSGLSGVSGLYAVLVDKDGIVVGTSPVSTTDGTYIISGAVDGQTYTVLITTNSATVGATAPNVQLPSGWESTGEFNGSGTGNDGTADGKSAPFTISGGNATLIDFGIKNPSAMPVTFATIEAKIANGMLMLYWTSLMEKDNDHYEIEVSKNGMNFTKIGEVLSKAANGNSDQAISYDFSKELSNAVGFLGISVFSLGIILVLNNRRRRILYSMIIVLGLILFSISCTKQNQELANNNGEKLFVRIVQVDKDGAKKYSKIVKAVKED